MKQFLMSTRGAVVLLGVLLVAVAAWINLRREPSIDEPAGSPWLLETQQGAVATLEHMSDPEGRDVMRVMIAQLADPTETWHVKLVERPFVITAGVAYIVSFRARAEEARPVGCAVGNNHEPWESLGVYHEHMVTNDWVTFECPFTANADDSNARLFFDLGKSDTWVELTQVVVRDETNDRVLTPT